MLKRLKKEAFLPSGTDFVSELFLRGLGGIYLIAIIPFFWQYKGIMGEDGVQPATQLLDMAWASEGIGALFHFPSLYWLMPNDGMLLGILLINTLFSIGLCFNSKPFLSALLAWVTWTSFVTIGSDFTIIIIDLFLSEVGFLGVLLAFAKWKTGYTPKIIYWIFLLLNFRLWFSMGMVKFYFPGDSWANFTFFNYFFPYQPMPNPASWFFHKLPQWTHSLAIIFTFVIEMIFPFFIFMKKRWRWLAALGFIGISLMIWLTGNYGYFNPLTILIVLFLFRDEELAALRNKFFLKKINLKINKNIKPKITIDQKLTPNYHSNKKTKNLIQNTIFFISSSLAIIHFIYIALLFSPRLYNPQNHLNYFAYFESTQEEKGIKKAILAPFRLISNLRIVNPYGVFKDMSRFRVELRFEGSLDGKNWRPYEFHYIPSGNTQTLRFFAPHYPRLDHLMYYESYGIGIYNANPHNPKNSPQNPLNPYYTTENPWICNFMEGLLTNNPYILGLLRKNPFNESPPNHLRVRAFLLNFTDGGNENWWEEEYLFTPYDSSRDEGCRPLFSLQEIVMQVQRHYKNKPQR